MEIKNDGGKQTGTIVATDLQPTDTKKAERRFTTPSRKHLSNPKRFTDIFSKTVALMKRYV